MKQDPPLRFIVLGFCLVLLLGILFTVAVTPLLLRQPIPTPYNLLTY